MAIIRIGIDPLIHLGPLTFAWHGITIALGIVIGALAAARWLRRRDLAAEPMYTFAGLAAVGGIARARLFYLLSTTPAGCSRPSGCSRVTASRSTAASSSPRC